MHTGDDAFGSELLRGAMAAYPSRISVKHILTRGIGALKPDEVADRCPGHVISGQGRIQSETIQSALADLNWGASNPALRKIVVCGPQTFEGVVYEMLGEFFFDYYFLPSLLIPHLINS